MKSFAAAVLGLAFCASLAGCSDSGDSEMTPEELHESCIAVFERKGGPPELGQQMCDSMKAACESDPSGEDCKKAQRIVKKG